MSILRKKEKCLLGRRLESLDINQIERRLVLGLILKRLLKETSYKKLRLTHLTQLMKHSGNLEKNMVYK